MELTHHPIKQRLQELDALRGIGATMVVLFHYTTRYKESFPDVGHVGFYIGGGNYRTYLFFAISGFAIFFTMDRLKTASDFVVNRASRLFPAYWAAIFLTLGFEEVGQATVLQIPPLAVLVNFSMLQSFLFMPPVDGAYWTLAVEVGFYACMLALWRFGGLKRLEWTMAAWLGLRWILVAWPDMPERVIMLLVLRYIPFFIIGMASYRVWAGQRQWKQQVPILAFTLFTIGMTSSPDVLGLASVLVACFYGVLRGWLRFICVRPLLWLGSISYSLYLAHQHIGFVVMLQADAMGAPPLVGFFMAITVALTLGFLIHRYVEVPATRVISQWWKDRKTARTVATV